MNRYDEYYERVHEWFMKKTNVRGEVGKLAAHWEVTSDEVSKIRSRTRKLHVGELQTAADYFREEPPRAIPLNPKLDAMPSVAWDDGLVTEAVGVAFETALSKSPGQMRPNEDPYVLAEDVVQRVKFALSHIQDDDTRDRMRKSIVDRVLDAFRPR